MEVLDTALREVKIVVPRRIGDARGFFSEVWNARDFSSVGIDAAFVQDNHVRSPRQGHVARSALSNAPGGARQASAGDARGDFRRRGRHSARIAHVSDIMPVLVLSADNWHQLWVPAGFAHGYCTLEDDTEVQYKVTDFYSPPHERGIAWNDPS